MPPTPSVRSYAAVTLVVVLVVGPVAPSTATPLSSTATAGDATGTLSRTQANGTGLSSWTAPPDRFDALETPADLTAAIRNDTVTRTDAIAREDLLVLRLRGTGFFGALSAEQDDDETETEAFVDLVSGDDFRFRMRQQDPPANRERKELDLRETVDDDGLTVVSDEGNGTLYLVARTDRLDFDRTGDEDLLAQPGERYRANFTITEDAGLGDRRSFVDEWRLTERTLSFDTDTGGVLRLGGSTACNPLTGRTSVAPGTRLPLRVQSESGGTLASASARVQPDRTFRGFVDVTRIGPNRTVTVTARGFSASVDGVVGHVHAGSVSFADQNATDESVTVASVTLRDGGFVAVYRDAALDGLVRPNPDRRCPTTVVNASVAQRTLLGASNYTGPGTLVDVPVALDRSLNRSATLVAIIHRDDDGDRRFDFPDGDEPYTLNGSVVADAARVSVASPTPTPGTATPVTVTTTRTTTAATPTAGTGDPATASPTTTAGETPTTGTGTATDGPGFGTALTLLSLLAAGLLASRR